MTGKRYIRQIIYALLKQNCALFKLTLTCDCLLSIFSCPVLALSSLKIVSFATKLPKLLFTFFALVLLLLHIGKMFPLAFLVFLKIHLSLIISIKSLLHQKQRILNKNNIYLLKCVLLCARFVVYSCKFGDRIPTALEFYQEVQKVKSSEFILSKNYGKINLFRKKNGICYSEFIQKIQNKNKSDPKHLVLLYLFL